MSSEIVTATEESQPEAQVHASPVAEAKRTPPPPVPTSAKPPPPPPAGAKPVRKALPLKPTASSSTLLGSSGGSRASSYSSSSSSLLAASSPPGSLSSPSSSPSSTRSPSPAPSLSSSSSSPSSPSPSPSPSLSSHTTLRGDPTLQKGLRPSQPLPGLGGGLSYNNAEESDSLMGTVVDGVTGQAQNMLASSLEGTGVGEVLGAVGDVSLSNLTSTRGLASLAQDQITQQLGVPGGLIPIPGSGPLTTSSVVSSLAKLDSTGAATIAVAATTTAIDIFQNGLAGGRAAAGWDFFSAATQTSAFLDNSVTVLQEVTFRDSTVYVEEIPCASLGIMAGIAQRVRVVLNQGAFRAERKAFHYSIGDVELSVGLVDKGKDGAKLTLGAQALQVTKKLAQSTVSDETFIKPLYKGTGEVFLEPAMEDFHIFVMRAGDKVVIETGCWYASSASIEVGLHVVGRAATALFGRQLFHTKLKGEGWFVLKLPVPFSEIHRIQISDSKVRISDSNIVLLRRGAINHTIETATKSFVGSKASGEGVVHVYSGTGEVWAMPTLNLEDLLIRRFTDTQAESVSTTLMG